jgi:hypothetical protein
MNDTGESMYFVMDCDEPENDNGEALMEIHNCFRAGNVRNWRGGRALARAESLPDPIDITYDPLRGYQGPPVEFRDVCIPIMSARLADVLKEAGVDNIVYYPARLTNSSTGEQYDYRAFNIVGTVAVADLGESEWSSYDGQTVADVSFTRLALDESRAEGRLLFRLGENINAVVVRATVRDRVLAAGLHTMKFTPASEWMHL